jgi:Tol biopolymer transport system component
MLQFWLRGGLIICMLLWLAVGVAKALGGGRPAQYLAFSAYNGRHWDVYVLDAGLGVALNITRSPLNEVSPAWSTDGRLAYVARDNRFSNIRVYDLRTSLTTPVTNGQGYYEAPVWSPDGRLAYQSVEDMAGDVYVFDPNTRQAVNLTKGYGINHSPAWSAAGQLAFVSTRDGTQRVYIADLKTERLQCVCNSALTDAREPVWSWDGRVLAFQAYEVYGDFLFVFDPQTQAVKWLAGGSYGKRLAWARDGRLTLVNVEQGQTKLSTVDLAADQWRHIVLGAVVIVEPTWSADGQLAFVSGDFVNETAIYRFDVTARRLMRLTAPALIADHPTWWP